MIRDFFNIIMECIASLSGVGKLVAFIVAILLGILCWIMCSSYTRLWNKRFRVRFQHHLLCLIAALFTVIFTINYRAVGNLGYIVDAIIDNWYENLMEDDDFHSDTYATAWVTLEDGYPDAFRGVPEPGSSASYIPFRNGDMIQICVSIYVDEACAAFSTEHPFLNAMLSARPGISEDEIESDILGFFRNNPGEVYPLERAVEIAAEHIRESLLEQSPKTVWKTRLILIILFLVIQLIPFGTIGYYAYKDLKIGKHDYLIEN